ncbi:MAG: plastocyanin/azurin family copper-binding protein [Phycisphaerae bacterium]
MLSHRIMAMLTAVALIATAGILTYPTFAENMGGMKMGPMPAHLPKPGRPISYAAAKPLIKYSNATGMLMGHGKHKSVMFMGHKIHIVMVAVEPGSPDQTFEIHKLVDPEITVPAGSKISLTVLNMDFGPGMIHGVVIGQAKPPYKTIVPLPLPGQLAEIPLIMPRTKKSVTKSMYYMGTTTFTAPQNPGTYYYLCQMPGHAKTGMYGKFVVTP